MAQSNPTVALYGLAGGYFTLGVASLAVVGLAGPMSADLAVSQGTVAQLVTVFALAYAVAAPLLQVMVGGQDRRMLVLAGLGLLAVGLFLAALAPGYGVMLASRIIMAVGSALVGPMASSLAAGMVEPARQARALGTVFGGLTIATVVGVPLSSYLGAALGWRDVTAALGLLSLLVAGLIWATLPRDAGIPSPRLAALGGVLTDPVLAPALMVALLLMAGQFATYALLGAVMVARVGMTPSLLPLALLIYGVGGIVGNAVAGRLADRIGAGRTLLVSMIGMAGVFAALAVVPPSPSPWLGLALVAAWAVFGMLSQAPQQKRLVELAPDRRGLVLALNASALYLGMSLGAAGAGALAPVVGPGALPWVSAGLVALGFGAYRVSLARPARPARTV